MAAPVPEQLLIFAGQGTYPQLLAQGARKAGVARIVVAGVRGMTSRRMLALADESALFGVGEVERALDWIEKTGVRQMVMVGQITPSALFRTRFDALGRSLLGKMTVKNAHTLFGKVAELLTARGVTVLPASSFMDDHLPQVGTLSQREPDAREWADIRLGFDVAMRVCSLDIGQTVVVKEGMILAVEAFEGTDKTILRSGRLGGKNAVVIKVAKEGHDIRFDIPVIGAKTLPILRRAHISALALQAGRMILLDRDEVIRTADRLGMAVVAVDSGLSMALLS